MYINVHDNVVLNICQLDICMVYNISVYVEMFIPHHMYVCVYVNILTDIGSHCRAGAVVVLCIHRFTYRFAAKPHLPV
jgi:hypothetical protein